MIRIKLRTHALMHADPEFFVCYDRLTCELEDVAAVEDVYPYNSFNTI